MAYNSKKGTQQSGDIQFENDPTDTQIDFDNDFVAIKTNARQRFIVSGSFITSSVPLSCSVGISAGSFNGDSLTVGGSTIVTVAKQLKNIASLDTTTEATIESAIDTLANLGSMGGSGAELEALGSLDIAQGLKINNVNFVDASRNITGSGLLTSLAGVTLDAGARIGVAGDTDLMTLTANTVDISGRINFDTMLSGAWASTISAAQITASLGITGSAVYTDSTTIDTIHVSSSLNISGSKFYGDGSTLSNLPTAGISWDGSTANGVATYKDGDEATVESNLTFDGTDLGVSDKIFHIGDTDTYINFTTDDINFHAGGVNFLDLTEDTQNEATFNEGGVDVDFRVESENDTHMLFVDAANDAVSIGVSTDAPAAVLEVQGDGAAGKPTFTVIHAENTNNAVNITADSITTAKALRISADALTTGNALYIDDDSSSTGTRNTAIVIQNNAAALNATALAVQSDGGVTGVNLDKNYSDTTEASIVGINIDFDKTGASTSDNNMFGIQLDMDNTTATNGNNYMYGLHVTPTLTHAADAGGSFVYGAHISAQGGTNGSSLVQGARIEAAGGDFNYGIQLDVEDGPNNVDFRIESSADNGDYFQIQTTTNGATTITTQDDNATAAHLTFNVDGDITLDPAGGDVFVDGNVSGSGTLQAVGAATLGNTLAVSGNVNIGGPNQANSPLYVKAASDNSVVSIFKSPSHDTILGITGSGQVVVGGVYVGAKLNVTGAISDMLFQAKSGGDIQGTTFYVSGSGELWNSGSVTLKTVNPTIHLSSSLDSSAKAQIGLNSSNNILIQNGTSNKHIVFKTNDNGTLREGFRLDGAVPEVVVNQTSDSLVDFRVESDNQTHMLYVEGAADKVGINTNEPTHTFSVNGATSISGSTAPTVLEVTGTSNSKLILARSDMTDPAFYVSGSGDVFISGSLRTKQFSTTIHNFNNSGLAAYYIPFMSTVEAVSPTYLDHMIAPADGRLVKAFLRIDGTQSGSVTLDVHATDLWQESIAGSPSKERVTRIITHRNNTYMFPTSGSVHFSEGDIVGVRIDPHASSSNVNVTCVWEYDYRFM